MCSVICCLPRSLLRQTNINTLLHLTYWQLQDKDHTLHHTDRHGPMSVTHSNSISVTCIKNICKNKLYVCISWAKSKQRDGPCASSVSVIKMSKWKQYSRLYGTELLFLLSKLLRLLSLTEGIPNIPRRHKRHRRSSAVRGWNKLNGPPVGH